MQEPSLVAGHPEIQPLLMERAQRAKLLEAMVQAVAEKGYAAATVAEAVRLARVSRGTFYALFTSKEACFAEAYALGADVLEARVAAAVRAASDWRAELRLGLRAYLQTLHAEPRFARAYLLESHHVPAARDAVVARFAARYGRSFLRSGLPVPPPEALFVLAAGVDQLACARVRAGDDVLRLEDTLVGCAVRLVATEEDHAWT